MGQENFFEFLRLSAAVRAPTAASWGAVGVTAIGLLAVGGCYVGLLTFLVRFRKNIAYSVDSVLFRANPCESVIPESAGP